MIPVPALLKPHDGGALRPFGFGDSTVPFSAARVDPKNDRTTSDHPFRATGMLCVLEGKPSEVCSAFLMKPGVIVMAAHRATLFGWASCIQDFSSNPPTRAGPIHTAIKPRRTSGSCVVRQRNG